MYLIDTHVLIWFLDDSPKLPESIRRIIGGAKEAYDVYISIASFWEMTIKASGKKLSLENSITDIMKICEKDLNFSILHVRDTHLEVLMNLQWAHKDPFDRMIISQALAENMTLISADKLVKSYPVHRLWEE